MSRAFNDMQIMDGLKISPFDWENLHRWDRAYFRYYFLLKNYYEALDMENIKRKNKQNQTFKANLPKTRPRGRG